MDILILSPHLDDAIFSLSSLLLNYKGNVVIATLFTQENKHNFKGDYALYADMKTRKLEDYNAFEKIMSYNQNIFIKRIYLNLPDELFRSNNLEINKLIQDKLLNIKNNYNFKAIYCPLAIGEHTDHILTYNNCIKIFKNSHILFYCDYPYCNLKLNTIKRLNSLQINHTLKLTYNDVKEYYCHPIYKSSPFFIRIVRIIINFLSIIFPLPKKYDSETYRFKTEPNLKHNIVSNYFTQIEPIFGSFYNLNDTLKKYSNEVYLNIVDLL